MTSIIITSLLVITTLGISCDLMFESRHPSDEALEKTFQTHEAEFDKLIGMVKENPKVVRIAHDFTWLDTNTAWPRPESELGFSKERWNEYRHLFRELKLKGGINRPEHIDGVTFLMASTIGNVGGGSEKGYAYLTNVPSQLVESLDAVPTLKEYMPVYRKLKGNWYIYYMWSG